MKRQDPSHAREVVFPLPFGRGEGPREGCVGCWMFGALHTFPLTPALSHAAGERENLLPTMGFIRASH